MSKNQFLFWSNMKSSTHSIIPLYLHTFQMERTFLFLLIRSSFSGSGFAFPFDFGCVIISIQIPSIIEKKEINLWNWYLSRVCSTQISNWNLYSRCWWSWRIVGIQLFLINSLVVCSINQNRLTLWSLWTFLFGILRENEKNHSILLAFVMLAVS